MKVFVSIETTGLYPKDGHKVTRLRYSIYGAEDEEIVSKDLTINPYPGNDEVVLDPQSLAYNGDTPESIRKHHFTYAQMAKIWDEDIEGLEITDVVGYSGTFEAGFLQGILGKHNIRTSLYSIVKNMDIVSPCTLDNVSKKLELSGDKLERVRKLYYHLKNK